MRTSAFLAVPAFAAIALAQTVRLEPSQSSYCSPMLGLVLRSYGLNDLVLSVDSVVNVIHPLPVLTRGPIGKRKQSSSFLHHPDRLSRCPYGPASASNNSTKRCRYSARRCHHPANRCYSASHRWRLHPCRCTFRGHRWHGRKERHRQHWQAFRQQQQQS